MTKYLAAFVALLGASAAYGLFRKLRGGTFFPTREVVAGEPQPQSLKEMVERDRAEK